MTIYQWLWFGLIYLLTGQVFSLVYVMTLVPKSQKEAEKKSSAPWLGLMGVGWPLYLALDLVLTLAGGLGAHSKTMLARFEKK
jgi:hypothetical protein